MKGSQRFYTNTQWLVEIDDKGTARHTLTITLFNPDIPLKRATSPQYLSVQFPGDVVLDPPKTRVIQGIEDIDFAEGYGWDPRRKRYEFLLRDLERPHASLPAKVDLEVSFVQRNSVMRAMSLPLFQLLGAAPRLAGDISLRVRLPRPRVSGYWARFWAWILRLQQERPYKANPTQTPSHTPQIQVDLDQGEVTFHLRSNHTYNISLQFQVCQAPNPLRLFISVARRIGQLVFGGGSGP